MRQNKLLAKTIAGEITLAENPGVVMRKWREIFMVKQCDLARCLRISSSVISDYEAGRRPSPGTIFVRRYIETLITEDLQRGGATVKKFSEAVTSGAIMDIRDFLSPVSAEELIEAVKGELVAGSPDDLEEVWGYTVIDSIKAILELSEKDFISIYGASEERALIFTKVHLGRSPMIAIKVTKPKPRLIVLHGLPPKKVDRLALKIAAIEKIPLVVSRIRSEEELVKKLREHRFKG